jgi:hypothetical protein
MTAIQQSLFDKTIAKNTGATMSSRISLILASCIAMSFAANLQAQMDVDQADTLNFEEFHKHKDTAIKIYQTPKGDMKFGLKPEANKVYEAPKKSTATATESAATKPATSQTPSNTAAPVQTNVENTAVAAPTELPVGNKGQRFEIRERFSLSKSTATPYNAITVIEALNVQMAGVCKNGWEKTRDFTLPIENDFYQHYEFECL